MSKLRDRIRRLGRPQSAPMGFARAAAPRPPSSLLLFALLGPSEAGDGTSIERALEGGADGIIAAAPKPGASKDVWWGHVLSGGAAPAGADFVVAGAGVPLDSLPADAQGIVIEVDEAWSDTTLRAVEVLDPDALYVRFGERASMKRLLDLRRLSLLGAPLLLEVGAPPDAATLRLLRDAGVAGLVAAGDALRSLPSLREQVNALPPRKRKRDDADAVIPRAAVSGEDDEFAHEDRVHFPQA